MARIDTNHDFGINRNFKVELEIEESYHIWAAVTKSPRDITIILFSRPTNLLLPFYYSSYYLHVDTINTRAWYKYIDDQFH